MLNEKSTKFINLILIHDSDLKQITLLGVFLNVKAGLLKLNKNRRDLKALKAKQAVTLIYGQITKPIFFFFLIREQVIHLFSHNP